MVKRAIIKRRVKRKISAAPAPEIIKKNIKEENLQLSPKSTYSKLIAIFVLIITFFVGNSMVIQPTIKEASLVEPDLMQKKSFLDTAQQTKLGKLEQNYRSSNNIVQCANSLIKKNQFKLDKTIWTSNEDGDKILVNKSQTDSDEGRFIASSIFQEKNNEYLDNSAFAVLYRTNAQSRSIEDAKSSSATTQAMMSRKISG